MAAVSTPLPVDQPGLAPRSRIHRILDGLYPYGYITPSILFMVIASFFPIVFTIYIAMTNFGQGHITSFSFVGLKNFTDIFTNNTGLISLSGFAGIFEWTVAFAAVTTALSFAGGLFLANLLNNENMWERNFYRTVLIIPWALPGLIAILAWGAGILEFPYGLLDTFLGQLGISAAQQPQWLNDPFWARAAVFMVGFWLGYPFMMTACLGALQSISPEVLQAAEIDGATPIQKFFRVTLPLLRLATLPLIISTFAYNLNNFGVVYLLTGGGPPVDAYHGATDILPTVVYKFAYADQKYYLACALGVLIFLIIGSFSAVNMKLSGAFQEVGR